MVESSQGLRIEVGQRRALFSLRSWSPAVASLPTQVGTVRVGPPRVLCIGPSTWLALGGVMAAQSLACVDLTDGLATIEISGTVCEDLFSSVCALDFHPGAFATDTCRRTRLAGLPVIIDRRSACAFECHVSSSYLAYLLAVLRDGAAGLGKQSE